MKHFIVKRKKNKKDTVPSRTAQLDALEPFSAGKMKPHCTKHSKPVPALGSWDTLKLWSLTQTFQSELCCWSVAQARSTLCDPMDAACHASLSCTLSWSLLKLMSIESMIPSNHLILCHLLLLLPSIFPSISVFTSESALHIRWTKYWNFSFSISPADEYSGLIFFRLDWFDFLAV